MISELAAIPFYDNKVDKEELNSILVSILLLRKHYIERISHIEPGIKPSIYFSDFKEKFNKDISELIDQITNLE